ncbi:unnamed protein product [Caenorhabditis brenneri]
MDPRLMRLAQSYFAEKEKLQRNLEIEGSLGQFNLELAIDQGERNIERLENLKKQLIEPKDSQMEMEHRHYAKLLDMHCVEVEKERGRIATLAVLREYARIMYTSYKINNALKMVKFMCLEDSPETFKAEIIVELYDLRTFQHQLQEQLQKFPQVLLNESRANKNTVDVCRGFISQVKETMDNDIVLGLCDVFPDALENGDQPKIRSFLADTDILIAELSLIRNGSILHIEHKKLKEHTAPSTQEIIIDSLKKSLFQTKNAILLIIIAWILCFCR